MTLNYFLAYFVLLFSATIIPGPSMLLAVNHGANYGISKASYTGFGNLIGNLLMAIISFLGLGVILIASGLVFNIIKWLGVAYLVYIGIKMITAPVQETSKDETELFSSGNKSALRLFIDGFVIAIGNPKGILFFTALFPQFVNMNQISVNAVLVVFITLSVVAYGCFMLYAAFGVKLNSLFRIKSFRKVFNRVSGSLMIVMGFTLAFSKKLLEK